MEIIKDNVRVEWVCLGEGYSGDYDPEDPEDAELLRFDVFRWDEETRAWEEVPDGSYCTCFPAAAPEPQKRKGLKIILDEIFEIVRDGYTPKRLGEQLSHINPTWN